MKLPDTDFWFALLVPEHPFHHKAHSFWEEANDLVLNRIVALGLMCLLANAVAMGQKPPEVAEA